jgi:hypothetical protein
MAAVEAARSECDCAVDFVRAIGNVAKHSPALATASCSYVAAIAVAGSVAAETKKRLPTSCSVCAPSPATEVGMVVPLK